MSPTSSARASALLLITRYCVRARARMCVIAHVRDRDVYAHQIQRQLDAFGMMKNMCDAQLVLLQNSARAQRTSILGALRCCHSMLAVWRNVLKHAHDT
jgi:hypothetical protein